MTRKDGETASVLSIERLCVLVYVGQSPPDELAAFWKLLKTWLSSSEYE